MNGEITVSLGAILGFAGFILQIGLTVAAVAFSHGALKQRVTAVEEKLQDHSDLSKAVAKLEAEMEAIGREIKNLRDDFRRVLDEFSRAASARTQARL